MSTGKVGPQGRRETVVPDNALYAALTAMAAVIEEPHCYVGADELRGLVRAHARLSRALALSPDYVFVEGRACASRNRSTVVKDARGVAAVDVKLVPVPRQRLNALPARDEAAA
jgi:hypothetical protein